METSSPRIAARCEQGIDLPKTLPVEVSHRSEHYDESPRPVPVSLGVA